MPFREIIPAPAAPKKSGVAEDVARSSATGLTEGILSIPGAFGDIRSVGESIAGFIANKMGSKGPAPKMQAGLPQQALAGAVELWAKEHGVDPRAARIAMSLMPGGLGLAPTTQELIAVGNKDQPLYQPQTKPGEYARTTTSFAAAGTTPGRTAQRVARVIVPSAASETAGQVTKGKPIEPYARVAGAVLGGGSVEAATRSGPRDRLLAQASRPATDDQIAAARALMEQGAERGVRLTMAEALQQVTDSGTGMGRLQRVVEGTQAGSSRVAPVMAERPAQVRQAITSYADTIAPPTDQPSMLAAGAQESAEGALNSTRQFINAWAKPHYDRLPGQSLPEEQFQQLSANPSFQAALADVRGNPELAPLLNADLPMDQAARMTRAQQQGFTVDAYHGTTSGGFDRFDPARMGSVGEADRGFFFSDSPEVANTYAYSGYYTPDDVARVSADWAATLAKAQSLNVGEKALASIREQRDAILAQISSNVGASGDLRPSIMPVKLRMTDPKSVDAGGKYHYQVNGPALQDGRDTIIQNVRDPGGGNLLPNPDPATTYVVNDPDAIRSRFDAFAPPNPDNDLNVINRVVQRLDEMKDTATPSPANPQGSNTLASQRAKAVSMAQALASDASPDWRAARDAVASGREQYLEPLQRGPLGTISQQPDLRAQTGALFPAQPMEGAPAETRLALEMMGGPASDSARGLVRQQIVNSANEATQDLQAGPNQWGGAGWAAKQMGNPEQAATLRSGVDAVGGDASALDALAEIMRATGKRQAPGSMTAYNARDLEELGRAGALGEVARTGLNPPGVFRRIGEGFQNWQTERNADRLAEAILESPAEAEAILMRAREVVPPGAALQAIERTALAAALARRPQEQEALGGPR